MKKRIQDFILEIRLDLVVFGTLLLLAGVCFSVLRTTLLKNAHELGNSLAESYALEEKSSLTVCETLALLGSESLEGRVKECVPRSTIKLWLNNYNDRLASLLGEGAGEAYAVAYDTMLTIGSWDSSGYDFENAEWYQMAMEAEGELIFTHVYEDTVFHNKVITMAKKCDGQDAVFAIDLVPDKFDFEAKHLDLPEGTSFFLCDVNGTLVYRQSRMERGEEEIQSYLELIQEGIRSGRYDDYNASITNPEGEERGVYYYEMDNGWTTIITMDRNQSLHQLHQMMLWFSVVILMLLTAFAVLVWRDATAQQNMAKANETNRVLGNSYYAIYRISLEENTFESIKRSPFGRPDLPDKGSYDQLMEAILEVLPEDTRDDFKRSFSVENVKNLVEHRIRDYGGDFQRHFADGYRWVNIRMLYDETVSANEVVLCFKEVQGEKQNKLQEQKLLQDSLHTMQKSEQSKQAFFRNMSHDMRTPLNAIIGLTDLALTSVDQPEKTTRYLEKIAFSGRQLLTLINDILEMSRLEQGKVELENQQIDLLRCLEDCTDTFRIQAEKEGKSFAVDFDIRDREVLADPSRISQVLNNLLSNAFKFTAAGDAVSVEVTQRCSESGSSYKLVVADTGIGLSQEFLPKLFEPYARETRFGTRKVMGTGLGMPIVKSLVTQMSGTITVDSRLNEGTTFTIVLPLQAVKSGETGVAPAGAAEQSSAAPAGAAEQSSAASLEGRHILLAEDNLINMEIATEMLTRQGVTVTQAMNGMEAVEAFLNAPPFSIDAILMDMQMPEMDGCEAARAIRELSCADARTVPIIAVTANAFAEDVMATTAAGMNAHISKPIDCEVLCRTLDRLLNGQTDPAAAT